MLFENYRDLKKEYPYLNITAEQWLELSNDERDALIANQKKIYADLAQRNRLDVDSLTVKSLTEFSNRESGGFTEEQKIFLRSMIVATGIREKYENLKDKDIFRLMAQIGNSEKLKAWYEKSKSISDIDINESLVAAAENGHAECVKYLIENCGEQILVGSKGGALRWAAKNAHMPCVKYLIENCGEQISPECKGRALVSLILNKDRLGVKYLIKQCSAQIPCKFKGKALKWAAMQNYMWGVKHLIKKCGAQILTKSKERALKNAAENGHVECVKCLIENCGEQISDESKGDALELAVENDQLPCVEYLIKQCDAQIRNQSKNKALQYAASRGYPECVKYLIKACGAQITDDFKAEALLSAVVSADKGNKKTVKGKHKEVVKILIRIPDFVISKEVLMLVLEQAIHSKDHDIIHLLALQNIGNEKPSNGNRYKTEDGKGWRFGMEKESLLRRTLEQERYQQLKDDSLYYIAYSQCSEFIDEKSKEKLSEDFMFLQYFEHLFPELEEKILSYVYCSPLSYTPEQWKKIRTFGDSI